MKNGLALCKSLFMATGVISLVTFTLILIFFRIRSLDLEKELSNIDRNIERHTVEESELRQTVVKMTSFEQVYHYCKETLGMDHAKQVERILVSPPRVATSAPPSESQKGWSSSVFSFLGFGVN